MKINGKWVFYMSYKLDFEKELAKLEPFWNSWYLDERLGEGSYSTVYKLKREEIDGSTFYSALKVICLPANETEMKNLYSITNNNKEAVHQFISDMAADITKEISIMYELKGRTNIVSYEDHQIIKNEDGLHYYILIRMEFLTSLVSLLRDGEEHPLLEKDVVRLGMDICSALETCYRHDIVHRDIKPDNLFFSADGNYKLGDFGISRKLEQTMVGSSKGTLAYMAPEIFHNATYNKRADIYSLGIVMYQLLNNNKLPLLPVNFKYADIQKAVEARLTGTSLPLPEKAQNELGRLVVRACQYRAEDRYETHSEMRAALEAYLQGKPQSTRKKRSLVPAILLSLLAFVILSGAAVWAAGYYNLIDLFPGRAGLVESRPPESDPPVSSDPVVEAEPEIRYGNLHTNLHNGAMIARDEDGFLYKSDNKGFYRQKGDEGEKSYLTTLIANNINLLDGWIYFTDGVYRAEKRIKEEDGTIVWEGEPSNIYRIKPDQAEPQKLTEDRCVFMMATSEGIVYMTDTELEEDELPRSSGGGETVLRQKNRYDLWFMNLDGSNKTKLVENMGSVSARIWVDKGWVYYPTSRYTNSEGKTSLRRVNLKNGMAQDILKKEPESYVIENNILYFIDEAFTFGAENPSIQKLNLDNLTAEPESICEIPFKLPIFNGPNQLNVYDGYLYIVGREHLYRLPVGGMLLGEPFLEEIFGEGDLYTMTLLGDAVYFVDREEGGKTKFCKVNLDGTNLMELPKDSICFAYYSYGLLWW